jgi:transposase
VWLQNYTWHEYGSLRWRETKELPPASIAIRSPYDCEAHFAKKRSTSWVGYKVHVTETCDEDTPRLITHVETTVATTNDVVVTDTIHEALDARDCLPAQHIVDRGYVEAELLVTNQEVYCIDLVGPTRDYTGWQARQAKGFAAQDFTIDWENQLAIFPAGTKSIHWMPAINNKVKPAIVAHWLAGDQPAQTRQFAFVRLHTVAALATCDAGSPAVSFPRALPHL